MKKFIKYTVILFVFGAFLCSCGPQDISEVESGCIDFKIQTHQSFPGPEFPIDPLLFINSTDPSGTPIEVKIEDHDSDGITELNVGYSNSSFGYGAMQVIFPTESFPNGVEIASVTLEHGHSAEVIALADDGSQLDFKNAPSQWVLTTLVVEGGSEPIRSMEWVMQETYVYKVCWGEEAVAQEVTPEIGSTEIQIAFEALPDGTPITADLFLEGDEYSSQGVILAGAPGPEEFADPPYCPDATDVAIHKPIQAGKPNFLTAVRPGEIEQCNTIPIEITFTSPVRQVTLTFFGPTTTFTMHVYNSTGTLLGEVQQDAVFQGGTFEITFNSGSSNISRVIFGDMPVRPVPSLTAITMISYVP